MKDYYDLYYLITNKEFSEDILKTAINKTFEKRETEIINVNSVLNDIKNADFIKEMWTNYSNHYPYAKEVKFEDVINAMEKLSCMKKILNYYWRCILINIEREWPSS